MRELELLAVSALTRVEVPAALWRKHRAGELSGPAAGTLVRRFEADLLTPRFVAVGISVELLDLAATLTARHALRAYDAVQLTSALILRRASAAVESFACFDVQLRDAAAREGFTLVPASWPA